MVVFSVLLGSGFIDRIAPTESTRTQSENYDNSNGSLGGAVASFFRRITATADQDEERLDDETTTDDVSNSEREGGENNLNIVVVPDNINLPHGDIVQLVAGDIGGQNGGQNDEIQHFNPDEDEPLAPNLGEGHVDDASMQEDEDDASSNNNDEIREPEPGWRAWVEEQIAFLNNTINAIRATAEHQVLSLRDQIILLREQNNRLEGLIFQLVDEVPDNRRVSDILNSYVNNAPTPYIGRAQV